MSLSTLLSRFKGKAEESKSTIGFVPYEEIDGKKTSKLGYFFLLLMVVFGVWQGNNFLNSLEKLIVSPTPNSSCLIGMENMLPSYEGRVSLGYDASYRTMYESGNVYYAPMYGGNDVEPSRCSFSKREELNGIPSVYESYYPELLQLQDLQKSLQDVSSRKDGARNNRGQAIDEYSVSLLESIAQKNQVLNMGNLRSTIVTSDDLIRSLEQAEADLKGKINEKTSKIVSYLELHRAEFEKTDSAYAFEMNVYYLERFALRLLFILPMFLFVWRRYSRSKNNRSEFSLIWGGIVAITALLLTQILLEFVYDILPHQLLQKVFAFLANFKIFFVALYWLGFILVPLFFGFLIYIIQKKYYNKKAIAMRAFKANKCPRCTMSVVPHMVFCPTCGMTLKVKCASCGGNTPNVGDFCELCGVKKGDVS